MDDQQMRDLSKRERGCRLEEQQIRDDSRRGIDRFHAKINNFHANMAEILHLFVTLAWRNSSSSSP